MSRSTPFGAGHGLADLPAGGSPAGAAADAHFLPLTLTSASFYIVNSTTHSVFTALFVLFYPLFVLFWPVKIRVFKTPFVPYVFLPFRNLSR